MDYFMIIMVYVPVIILFVSDFLNTRSIRAMDTKIHELQKTQSMMRKSLMSMHIAVYGDMKGKNKVKR